MADPADCGRTGGDSPWVVTQECAVRMLLLGLAILLGSTRNVRDVRATSPGNAGNTVCTKLSTQCKAPTHRGFPRRCTGSTGLRGTGLPLNPACTPGPPGAQRTEQHSAAGPPAYGPRNAFPKAAEDLQVP